MKIFSLLFALFFYHQFSLVCERHASLESISKKGKEGGFFVMLHDVQYGGELSTPLVTDELNPFL